MNHMFLLLILLLALTLVLLAAGLYLLWAERYGQQAKKIALRVRQLKSGVSDELDQLSILKQETAGQPPLSTQLLMWLPGAQRLQPLLQQSGLAWSLARFCNLTLLCLLLGVGALWGLRPPALVSVGAFCLLGMLPLQFVRFKRARRFAQFEKQLPEALEVMAGALRAGHALPGTFTLLAEEIKAPLGEEFHIVNSEITYGIAISEALDNFAGRIPLEDLQSFVVAVAVQRETGGNLAEILTRLSARIRERINLRGKIRVLSSEGRLSALILTALPLVVAGAIRLINPDYLRVFWQDPTGIKMTYVMLTLLLLGNLWMRKLVRIRV